MSQNTVKPAVIVPLLDMAGFFLPPFYIDTETTVEIVAEDADLQVQRSLD